MRRLLEAVDPDELPYNFCLRVAGGDLAYADVLYYEKPYSEVWRKYLSLTLYSRQSQ